MWATWIFTERQVQAEGPTCAKALRWADAQSVRGAVRRQLWLQQRDGGETEKRPGAAGREAGILSTLKGSLDPGGALGQTSPLCFPRYISRASTSVTNLSSWLFPLPLEPPGQVFPLQREKLSPEMSQRQWDEEAPQPWASAASRASHHPCCCADRGHLHASLTLSPGSWNWRSDQQQLDSPVSPEYQ